MLLNPFARRTDAHALAVGMAGVKMGDRVAQIFCADGARLAAIASKVGLSGGAAAYVEDEAAAGRVRKGAEQQGVLIEIEIAPPTRLPAGDDSFDLVMVDDAAGALAMLDEHQRAAALREARRIVRPGGRVMLIGAGTPTGFLKRAPAAQRYDRIAVLKAEGFSSVRELADREGLVFVEAVKPRKEG